VDWPAFRPMSPGAASRAKGHFEFAAEFSLGATVEIEGRFLISHSFRYIRQYITLICR
jgi:hypothetical protein